MRTTASLSWQRGEQPFVDRRYSRAHVARFDGGASVPMSSSPEVVRGPASDPRAVDPEEAFVASLSSCHLLWFLDLAAREGLVVDRYDDEPEGTLAAGADGRLRMTVVVLRPMVTFAGRTPSSDELRRLHDAAHHECYLANSVSCEMRVDPR
jgi:organic hydroperoxide reductase OsmC/OhrA